MISSLTRLLRQHATGAFFLSSAIGIVGGLASTASIAYVHQAIKSGVKPPLAHLGIFLALCLVALVTRTLSQYLLWNGCLRSTVTLITDLTARILATPLRTLEEIGPARLITAFQNDCIALTDTVITVPLLLLNGTVLLGCAAYLAWQNAIAAVVFLALVIVATSSTLLVIGSTRGLLQRARAQVDRLFEYFRAQGVGVKELKLNARRREDFMTGLHDTAVTASRMEAKVQTIYAASANWFQLVFLIPIGVLVFAVTNLFSISVSDVGAYALVLLYMTSTVSALSAQLQSIGRGVVAFSNIEQLGIALEKPHPDEAQRVFVPDWSLLELDGVTHRFAPSDGQRPFVVGPINLQFRRGELVFITGGNGSGKTTLAKILCGLYLPNEGTVRMDGVEVTPATAEAYRQKFVAIFWDFHLFSRLFGLTGPEAEQRAREQLEVLRLREKVDVVNGEFTTLNLSQGQRKRLALLVAALEDRQIYIFDEWAADQDREFRDHFYNHILPEMRAKGKTIFAISHDERYFHVADRVLKLDFGGVVSDTADESSALKQAAVAAMH